ncbi:MAG: hypothetical protein RIK87_20675 [Fuerstiella sp.]
MRSCSVAAMVLAILWSDSLSAADRSNILFIAVDDLNHWVGHLKRNEWTNLATGAEFAEVKKQLAAGFPSVNVPEVSGGRQQGGSP